MSFVDDRVAPRTVGSVLTAALAAAVLAYLLDLPTGIRTAVALPGLLAAPGYVWLAVAGRFRTSLTLSDAFLVMVISIAACIVCGVALQAAGLAVEPRNLGAALLAVTLPGVALLWRGRRNPWASRASRTKALGRDQVRVAAVALCCAGLFVGAVAWGATWQERVSSGPYSLLQFDGEFAEVEGVLTVRPGQLLRVPIRVTSSDDDVWRGELTTAVDGKTRGAQPLSSLEATVVRVRAPRAAGLHLVTLESDRDGSDESLTLTLRLRVSG